MGTKIFQDLSRYSKAQVRAINSLVNFMPQLFSNIEFKKNIEKTILNLTDTDFKYHLSSIDSNVNNIKQDVFFIRIKLSNSTAIYFLMDNQSARSIVDTLLGIKNNSLDNYKLSDVESGILIFVFNKILHLVQSNINVQNISLKIDNINGVDQDRNDDFKNFISLNFHTTIGDTNGFMSFLLPNKLINEWQNFIQPNKQIDTKSFTDKIAALKDVDVEITPQLGAVKLTPSELNSLEQDDIVVMDKTKLKLADKSLVGNIALLLNNGAGGSINGEIKANEANKYDVSVKDISYRPIIKSKRSTDGRIKNEPLHNF